MGLLMMAAAELFMDFPSGSRVFPKRRLNRRRGGVGGALVVPDATQARARVWPRLGGVWPPGSPPQVSFWLLESSGLLETLAFVWSNSENISYVTFLKYKNSRKQELALRHLVNRLVPKNTKYCIKMHIKHVGS